MVGASSSVAIKWECTRQDPVDHGSGIQVAAYQLQYAFVCDSVRIPWSFFRPVILSVICHCHERMIMNASTLFLGVIFGSFGLGFFVYGKRQKVIMPLISGIGLMVLPYFLSNLTLLILSGIILIALPFILKI
jgi:hypothetical protein